MLRAATVLSGRSLTQGYVNLLSGPALEEVTEQVCPWRFLSSPGILFSKFLHPILFQALKVLANLGSVLPGTISILRWVTTAGQCGSLGAKTHIKLPWTDGQKVLILTSQVRKPLALHRTHSQLPALGWQRLVSFTITSFKLGNVSIPRQPETFSGVVPFYENKTLEFVIVLPDVCMMFLRANWPVPWVWVSICWMAKGHQELERPES